MASLILASGALVALLVAGLLTPIIAHLARDWQCLDRPDGNRKSHSSPTPTLGGIAIVVGTVIGGGYLVGLQGVFDVPIDIPSLGVWSGALIVIGAGVFDDLKGIDPKAKFLLQVIAAYILLHAGYRVDLTGLSFVGDDPYQLALISMPITIVWVVGVINAVNLLDGLDGLAAGISVITFASFAAIFGLQGDLGTLAIALIIIGSIAGFLVHNFNPASIFMGDSGSLFLGYMLAVYSLDLSAHADPTMALLIPVVALGMPITDTTVAIARRFVSGKAIFAPDRDHIHHRLREVFSHRGSVLLLYFAALWFGVAAYLMAAFPAYLGYGVFGMVILTTGVGLRVLGYLQVREVARGLRYRFIKHRRRQAAGTDGQEDVPVEESPVDGEMDHSGEWARIAENDRNGHASSEPSAPELVKVES